MANSLGENVQGKLVVLNTGETVLCTDGFGCYDFTSGQKILGYSTASGRDVSFSGFDIEKLAEDQTIPEFLERYVKKPAPKAEEATAE